MNRVIGWLGDRVQVAAKVGTGEGTSNVLDVFVDDDGAVVAIHKSDPRHPDYKQEA